MTTILDTLAEKNEFPIVFIGSGMSKRFLTDFPDWVSLLKEFWEKAGLQNFFGELNNALSKAGELNPHFNEKERDHEAYIQIGATLENEYNKLFNSGNIEIKNFTQEEAFRTQISPLKKAIANRFEDYTFRAGVTEEYDAFVQMLLKAQIILTTNYDSFIEDSYNSGGTDKIKKYIGQRGFFNETFNYAELYKLHGCVEKPEDIVITKGDYEKFEKNSVLISAKIISMMLNSPIIFMGYSFKDVNIRKIINEFTTALSDTEVQLLEERLILLEWESGQQDIKEEVLNDRDLGCKLKVIKTDNFKLVFEKISAVNQGVAPSEVRRYQHVIKQLIVDSGKKGSLSSLLVAPTQLQDLEKRIGDGKLIVALGDATYIFKMPDLISYIYEYFFATEQLHTDVALRFIASRNSDSRLPFLKYTKDIDIEKTNLHNFDKEKIKQRISIFQDINSCLKTISVSNRIKKDRFEEIIDLKFKGEKECDVLSYNAQRIDALKIREYIKTRLEKDISSGQRSLSTGFRRLIMIYDFILNK